MYKLEAIAWIYNREKITQWNVFKIFHSINNQTPLISYEEWMEGGVEGKNLTARQNEIY